MNMVRGEHNLSTDTVRTSKMMFNQVSRFIMPYYQENRVGANIKDIKRIYKNVFAIPAFSIFNVQFRIEIKFYFGNSIVFI